ncbi:hypothetical protein AAWM_02588 [Aspergillus awamori]|uniref:Uncharacterized protein n=1 Tax=Aspergillus awamori TaxID=105351 RepID=A0A401KK91_ASPAW|nr:hypothetical protein AAWM_02588 [Aspergillus awamori]
MGVENRLSREEGYKTPEAIGFTEVNLCFAACAFSYQQKRIGVEQETANAEDNEALDLHREARREGQWQEVREKKGYADAAKSRGSDSCFDRLISSLEGLSGREIKWLSSYQRAPVVLVLPLVELHFEVRCRRPSRAVVGYSLLQGVAGPPLGAVRHFYESVELWNGSSAYGASYPFIFILLVHAQHQGPQPRNPPAAKTAWDFSYR